MIRSFLLAFAALFAMHGAALAQHHEQGPIFDPMFTDHAVLQRGEPIRVWGTAEPRQRLTIAFDGASISTRANRDGKWSARLPAHAAGGPYQLSVSARDGAGHTISNVLVGDVYFCSGQSNMEFQTRYATNAFTELNNAADDNIRLFNVERRIADSPESDFENPPTWTPAASESVGDFSAVCYFFGRDMAAAADVPVGLIGSSWGGTIIEAWMSEGALAQMPAMADTLARRAAALRDPAAARAAYARDLAAWWSTNDPGLQAGWNAIDFDDSAWGEIALGGFWESAGIGELTQFDGLVWYRTEFELTAAQAAGAAGLALGPADDIDITYLNGELVGAVSGWDTPRTYAISAGALREGRNVLAIGVLDTGGGGGLWGPANEMVLTLADGSNLTLEQTWRYAVASPLRGLSAPPQSMASGPNAFTVLYNGMVAPVAPYNIKGVLWYQGEANAGRASQYTALLETWMADWRRAFQTPDLAFFIVQLSSFGAPAAGAPQESSWAELREVQRRVTAADPRAALAVSYDVGDRFDIHPTQKRLVGERLARTARAMLLGEDIAFAGPTPTRADRVETVITVYFDNGPLIAYGDRNPIGFEICDADFNCAFANAELAANRVILFTRDIPLRDAAYVRFCWADGNFCNLYNEADLPAVPFQIPID